MEDELGNAFKRGEMEQESSNSIKFLKIPVDPVVQKMEESMKNLSKMFTGKNEISSVRMIEEVTARDQAMLDQALERIRGEVESLRERLEEAKSQNKAIKGALQHNKDSHLTYADLKKMRENVKHRISVEDQKIQNLKNNIEELENESQKLTLKLKENKIDCRGAAGLLFYCGFGIELVGNPDSTGISSCRIFNTGRNGPEVELVELDKQSELNTYERCNYIWKRCCSLISTS